MSIFEILISYLISRLSYMENTQGKIKCPNCENEYDSNFNYCPYCSQKNIDIDPKLKHFITEFLSANFNIDSKIFITLKSLILKPAELTREMLAGKREKYLTPVRLYLLISLIYFFVLSIDTHKNSKLIEINKPGTVTNDSTHVAISIDEVDADTLNIWERKLYNNIKLLKTSSGEQIFKQKLKNNISLGMFIFIPLTALILFLLFRRKIKYYIPNLIFAIHLQSIIFLWFTLLNLIELFFDNPILRITGLLIVIGIIFLWMKAFYETSTGKTIWKLLLFLTGWISLLIFFLGIVTLYSFWFIR